MEPKPPPSSPGWQDLSTKAKVFWVVSGIFALGLGIVIGVILTFSN